MPRKRRPVTIEDALAYAIGRKRKLKGPRKELYSLIIDVLLDSHGHATLHTELCAECATNLQDRPSKRAQPF